ncbi:MAG: helix-turn-helix domain-containing protein [Nanoarchaeota archaeon]
MENRTKNWAIKRYLAGMSTRLIASHLQISHMSVYRTIANYKKFGKTIPVKIIDRPKQEINAKFKDIIRREGETFQCGSVKIHTLLKINGFGVSQSKIQQISGILLLIYTGTMKNTMAGWLAGNKNKRVFIADAHA